MLITYGDGDRQPYPYYVDKRGDVDWHKDQLIDEGVKILLEVYV